MVDAVFFAPPWHDCFVDVGGAFCDVAQLDVRSMVFLCLLCAFYF
jgi:hypothetical protein